MRSNRYQKLKGACATLALVASLVVSATVAWAQEECQPVIAVDQPAAGATVSGAGAVSGWAVDPAFASGASTGILDVLVYRDGQVGAGGVLVGQSAKFARTDVDAMFGLSGAQAGHSLSVNYGAMSAGSHTLYVYGLTECGWAFSSVPVTVAAAGPDLSLDSPSDGVTVASGSRLTITGWAAERGGPGAGVDLVQIFADSQGSAGGILLGTARYGAARPDVAAMYGAPELTNSGFDLPWTVSGLPAGPHTLTVLARSASTGAISTQTVGLTVTGGSAGTGGGSSRTNNAIVEVESPSASATVRDTITVRGIAVDCAAGSPAARIKVYNGNATGTLLGEARLTTTNRTVQSLCGTGSGSGSFGWEYSLNSRNLAEGNRTLTVVAEFASGTASDTVNVNVDNRQGGGYTDPYNNYGGGTYGYNNCQTGYTYSGGGCTYVGSEYGYCQNGYAYQNGSCVYTGTGSNSGCYGYGYGYTDPYNNPYNNYGGGCGNNYGGNCNNYYYPYNGYNNYGNSANCLGGYGNCPAGYIYNATNSSCIPTGGGIGSCASGVIVLDQAFTTVPISTSVTLSGYALTSSGLGSAQAAQSVTLRDVSTNQASQTIPVTQFPINRTDAQNQYGASALNSGFTAAWNTSGLGLSGFSRIIEVTANTPACGTFSRTFAVSVTNSAVAALPTLSVNNAQANEGQAGASNSIVFTVSLSTASSGVVSATYQTANGTAIAGTDYNATNGVVTFQPGTISQTFTVTTIGDTTAEQNETFSVSLTLPFGATIAAGTGIGTIVNDD